MKYVKIDTNGVLSYAVCEAATAAAYDAPGVVVTVSDTPFLPQVKNAALAKVQAWAISQRIGEAGADRISAYLTGIEAIKAAPTNETVGALLDALMANTSNNLELPIKQECGRRIYAIASQNTQMNMTAACAAGAMSEADRAAYALALAWVSAMRARCSELIANADAAYALDSKWPVCQPSVVALAQSY